jgi:hypothetical protein
LHLTFIVAKRVTRNVNGFIQHCNALAKLFVRWQHSPHTGELVTMIEVKDIFVWYRDLPSIPADLTTIQQQEWKQRHASLFERSFVGQHITSCYASILDIQHGKITAFADYHLDYLVYMDGTHYHHEANTSRRHYAQISYVILYEGEQFYDVVKSIHKHQMVAFDGVLTNVRWVLKDPELSIFSDPEFLLSIQLSLNSIKAMDNRFLHAELLDEDLRYKPSLRRAMNEWGCFIATAAFGTGSAEVLELRRFRDAVLMRTLGGRLFVRLYYRLSPSIASVIKQSSTLRRTTRLLLTRIVVPLAKWLTG